MEIFLFISIAVVEPYCSVPVFKMVYIMQISPTEPAHLNKSVRPIQYKLSTLVSRHPKTNKIAKRIMFSK